MRWWILTKFIVIVTLPFKSINTLYTLNLHWCVNSVQFSSVAQSCLILCDPMNRGIPGPPVHHQLPEFTQTHVHQVSDAIQPFHPLSSPSPPAPNPFQHQSLFQRVNSSHEVAKVLEFWTLHLSKIGKYLKKKKRISAQLLGWMSAG